MTTISNLAKTGETVLQGVIDHESMINVVAGMTGVLPEVLFAEKAFPIIILALRAIQQSSGKSWGEAFSDLMDHLTPGKPAAPALSAPGDDLPDHQASTT